MRSKIRREVYAPSTVNSYCDWVKRFVKFHGFVDRDAMLIESFQKVEHFLTHLADTAGLITKLLYAGGLRITEAVRLRVQPIGRPTKG